MRLSDKLSRLSSAGPRRPAAGDARQERIADLRDLMSRLIAREQAALRERARTPTAPLEPLPGAVVETPHGPMHVVDTWLEPQHCHGRAPVRDCLDVDPRAVGMLALDPGLERVDPRRVLVIDTETTGLSAGGGGTLAFLLGMAWFEDESLHVQQLLLRAPGQEAPMLRAFAARLAECSCIVTYNGKSYDWPLLRTRFVMNRVPMPPSPPHLDLLHCARRIFRRRLRRVRLVDMEAEVLAMHRERDVSGAEIPSIYYDYLRGAEPGVLTPVIEHNAHDLIALAALLPALVAQLSEVRPQDDPRDHLGCAEVARRAGDEDRALAFARAAADGGGDQECTLRALMLAARLARRRGDVDAEERALTRALDATDGRGGEVHLALAKLYEHRRRDPGRALGHAAHTRLVEEPEAHGRRLGRLLRRLERARIGE